MARELTAELLADLMLLADPRISPDGRRLAASAAPNGRADEHPTGAIWLAQVDGSRPARRVTSGLAADSHPRWAADSATLGFLSDRAKRGTKQIHLLPLDGGEARPITDERGGVSDFAWLPGSPGRIVYLAADSRDPEDEEERRKKERDDAKVYGEFWPYARPAILDIDSGEVRRIDLGNRHVARFSPSPDGARLAVMLWDTPEIDWFAAGGTLGIVDLAGGTLTEIAGPAIDASDIVWSRDGRRLYHVARGGRTAVSSAQLWAVDAQTGASRRCLSDGAPFCINTIARPDDWDDLLVLAATGAGTTLMRFDVTKETFSTLIESPYELEGLSASADGAAFGTLLSRPDRPAELHAGEPQPDTHPRRLSDLHAGVAEMNFGPQEVVTWERAGFTLDGILIFPPGKSRGDGPLPAVVSIHGGPYGRWPNGFQFGRFGRWLAHQGYLVFMPNPRGGKGHGQAFAESVLCTVGNDDYLDIMAGLDMLIAQGLADPDRLGCGGWSQGGFMTAWAVGHTDRFKAAVMGAGVSDWGMMIATSDIPSYETLMGGGNPYESAGPHTFDAQSPISYLYNARTPTLIVHGENDERVPVSQGAFFHRGLRRYGVPTELVVYPREPHGIQERRHQIDLAERIAAWYRRWIPV